MYFHERVTRKLKTLYICSKVYKANDFSKNIKLSNILDFSKVFAWRLEQEQPYMCC